MLDRDEALTICERVLAQAGAAGAEDAEVALRGTTESYARFADNGISTSGRADDLQITVTTWVGRRRGAASGNDAAPAALEQLAGDAVRIAKVSPVDKEYVPTLGPMEYQESHGFSDATASIDVTARARALQALVRACRDAGVAGAGFHNAQASAVAVATANGNRRYFRSSEAGMSVTARTGDGTGSGYSAGDHFDLSRLDTAAIAKDAVGKAVRSREPQAIEPAAYPVILEPQAVANLVQFLTGSFDARMADEGRSPFSGTGGATRVGERLFSERINLFSDPMHPELPAVPSTGEGIPASRMPLIRNGVLENLEYSRYWAQSKQKTPSPGPVNFILEATGAASSMDEMIAGVERGLLVSRFWYVRLVDPRTIGLTGLTRDGLWWIEKGRIVRPVRNLRFNQSVLAMLAPWNVEALGAPRRRSPLMVPALKLASFTFTSISDAI